MIDYRTLSYFVSACEHENLLDAASRIGLAPSTLSDQLKSIEQELQVALFRRQGSGLTPRKVASWLYRSSVSLLLLEGYASRIAAAAADAQTHLLYVDINLRFAFGRLGRALNEAYLKTAAEEPLVMIVPNWQVEDGSAEIGDRLENLHFTRTARLGLTTSFDPLEADPASAVLNEEWVLVHHRTITQPIDRALAVSGIVLPALPGTVLENAAARLAERGIHNIVYSDASPADWARLTVEYPQSFIALPSSAVSARTSIFGLTVSPFDPPLRTAIIGDTDGDPISERFMLRLRSALADDVGSSHFQPVLTGRRVRYFNLAFQLRQVSAAARAANVVQPALSQQLQKLEDTLGIQLFERHSTGLSATPAAQKLNQATTILEERLDDLRSTGRAASFEDSQNLKIGLASILAEGPFATIAGRALARLNTLFPDTIVSIQQGSPKHLGDLLRQNRLGLALVDYVPRQQPHSPCMA